MPSANFFKKLNIFYHCRQYDLRLKECPSFLFLVVGLINIAATATTYFITTYFTKDPEPIIIITASITIFIFVIGYTVTKGFEKLAQANKMKTEFVSVASHQLRTPLSSIRWLAELLTSGRLGRLNPKQLDYLNDIQQGNERMIKLVNDLLDVSRIEMGRLDLKLEPTDILVKVKDLIKEFEQFAQASNVKINLITKPGLPLVMTDSQRIRLTIQNLIDNAIKYIGKDGRTDITIAPMNEKFMRISVKDTGVGIPEEQKKFIFQRFFRSDNILKHQTTGTGLGLYIAKAIIEASGGKMGFESKEGVGSTFWFTLPIHTK